MINKVTDRPSTLLKKETLAQVFPCEFCEISRNTFSTERLQTTASDNFLTYLKCVDLSMGKKMLPHISNENFLSLKQ